MHNYVGQQIDRYRITERLGMGGMAVVYKAYDTRLERDVALKLIRTGEIPESQHERLFKRFEREAKAQARFSHRNIIPVFDYGEVDGSPYLVMAFIPGGTLKDRLHGPVDWRQAVRWLIPVAEALSYAHQRGIVHRDVKPANILFDEEDQPILTDFGIAKVLETDEATLTGTGLGVGTPEYMAPEQWQGKTSAATDQYALGVVLYELITGRKPYAADTPAAVAIMQATEPLSPPSSLVRGIPDTVEKVLYKTLARDPQDRYADMGRFANAFQRLLEKEKIKELDQHRKIAPSPSTSESETDFIKENTWDTLDATSIESMDGAMLKQKRGLPKWVLWAGIGFVGLIILSLIIGLGGNLVNMDKEISESLSMMATETATTTIPPTATNTITPTKTTTLTPTPEPTMGIGSTMINEIDRAEMVYVPAGEFTMGSEEPKAWSREAPAHLVYLDSYWIYKYEVTNAEYRLCIESGICDADIDNYPDNQYPAIFVNWNDAQNYCTWSGGRLPTEAEWEKAAKGIVNRRFPWGNDVWCPVGGHEIPQSDRDPIGCLDEGPGPVGGFPKGASPYGALDMAGNVWEWVSDWYSTAYYANSAYESPPGPNEGDLKIFRGGSWAYDYWYSRVTFRFYASPNYSNDEIGFRCVVDEP